MNFISSIWNGIQTCLFPTVEEELGELTKKEKDFILVCELCNIPQYHYLLDNNTMGRSKLNRTPIVHAFIAKAVYNLPTTKLLCDYLHTNSKLRVLCGFQTKRDIPSESTFSRAFQEISELNLLNVVHENMIKTGLKEKIVGHVSRDGSAIEAREKATIEVCDKKVLIKDTTNQESSEKKEESVINVSNISNINESSDKKPVGRPRIYEKKEIVIDKQVNQTLEQNIAGIPSLCNIGTKKNSKGFKESWKGYKIHIDTIDGDIPVSALLSSASTYDNQVAIPLAQMTNNRLVNLYDVMDAAYDCKQIRDFSEKLNHVPIIDFNKRNGEQKEFDPAKKQRYNVRSSAERVNSNLKDNYGGNHVRVKGAKKVLTHLMFGILSISALQLFKMLN